MKPVSPEPEPPEYHLMSPEEGDLFFIAGLGSSAGGLEAFQEFFKNLPIDTGIGYVIVTHLDPEKKDILPDIIQRYTKMPVSQAVDNVQVLPDHVYIIPPNKDLYIKERVLKLEQPSLRRGVRLPIDTFFRSLAEDRREMAIGIIFSGMGTDGVLGVKAIKEKNGTVMAQDPGEAKFDSMPQSAINTGMVDYVAPAYDLPSQLVDYEKNYQSLLFGKPGEKPKVTSDLEMILQLVHRRTGHDLSEYKSSTLFRRIERRMTLLKLRETNEYIAYLNGHPEEIDQLFKELLIGVTNFFRDPEAFEQLKREAFPRLLQDMHPNTLIRVWVPGCSTGEEAYSIAMVMLEVIGNRPLKVQIFATDIDSEAIDFARKGAYPDNIAADVSEERLNNFFTRDDSVYKVKKRVREMIIFAEQDVAHDPPFTGMDLISCRNLLIYMVQDLQNKIISLFTYSLNPGGMLFLGSAETLGRASDMFTTIDNKWKIFRRKDYATRREVQTVIPLPFSGPLERMRLQAVAIKPAVSELSKQVLLDVFSPPAAIVDHKGDIIYIHGHTGKYLEPAPGKANMNIVAMARKGLSAELGIAIEQAKRDNKNVFLKGVDVQTNGDKQMVNVSVQPIQEPGDLKNFLMVAFQDVQKPSKAKVAEVPAGKREKYAQVLEELKYTKDRLQSTMEEMHASQEEMRSMNEELQSTNEELQSTNEELTTSKEEMQSLNEELVTVNSELQAKVDDLTRVNNDIKNLLNSTNIATIFLDNNLRITKFTPPMTRIFNLLPADTGRPITDISTNLMETDIDNLIVNESRRVIDTLATVENQVETKNGEWYNMRISPYRTVDNVIDGVVLTFSDVTDLKRYEWATKAAREYSEAIIATIREPLIVLDGTMHVVTANNAFYKTFELSPGETEKKLLFSLGNNEWNLPELKVLLEKVLPQKKTFEEFKVERDIPGKGKQTMWLNARKIETPDKKELILLSIITTPTPSVH